MDEVEKIFLPISKPLAAQKVLKSLIYLFNKKRKNNSRTRGDWRGEEDVGQPQRSHRGRWSGPFKGNFP